MSPWFEPGLVATPCAGDLELNEAGLSEYLEMLGHCGRGECQFVAEGAGGDPLGSAAKHDPASRRVCQRSKYLVEVVVEHTD
jgi:hypothetical protein